MCERWLQIPKEVRDDIDLVNVLQRAILNLTDETFDETVSAIVNSVYCRSEANLFSLSRMVLCACLVIPRRICIYARFCARLAELADPTNKLDSLKDIMKKQIVHWWWNNPFDNIYSFAMFLVNEFEKLGFYTAETIVKESINALVGKFQFVSHIACFLLYFGAECREIEPEMFGVLERRVRRAYDRGELLPNVAKYWETYDELKRTNWAAIKKVRENYWHGNEILKAILEDNVQEFEKLINGDINRVYERAIFSIYSLLDKGTFKMIDLAAIFAAEKVFDYLLNRGARIEDGQHGTVLIASCAAVGQSTRIIKKLEMMGADFSRALAPAVRCYSQTSSKWLIEKYPECVTKTSISGATALTQASLVFNIEIFKVLLEKGIDLNAQDGTGLTPFECMGEAGNPFLLQCFLSICDVDKTKGYPLIAAAQAGHTESIRVLLDSDLIDPNVVSEDGQCALAVAIMNSHVNSVKMLLDHPKVDVHNPGFDFLLLAAQQNSVEIFQMIAAKVDNDSWKQWSVTSPLSAAIRYEMYDMFSYLLTESGVDVNAKDESHNGITMIWLAVQQQSLQIAEILLSRPECQFENSVLVLAMSNKDKEMIDLLNKHISQCTS